ncbi:hypothetical protein EGR_06557 [Echinococcus granulosus]|uniref:Uncharacterized protein n=1 Tax=Echinococcus granulosus TaxID=6210 RepID=W6UBS7_ECHGR|nr:hypothetical protein EGR_06557 [Echinococcus granulosus]EUB58570.1 hypothetical protein EGR_06557 [Echinococcus granulosus]
MISREAFEVSEVSPNSNRIYHVHPSIFPLGGQQG